MKKGNKIILDSEMNYEDNTSGLWMDTSVWLIRKGLTKEVITDMKPE